MRGSRETFEHGALIFVALSALVATANAQDCSFLNAGSSPAPLEDRQLYYQAPGGAGWTRVENWSALDLNGKTASFAYVVREYAPDPRAGVLIIKSGRVRQIPEPAAARAARNVTLARAADPFDNGTCGRVLPFATTAVPAKSYGDYHDQGLNVPETSTIKAFHFKYAARQGRCRRTDDSAIDSIAPRDPRSNLSQFSFDRDVVAGGTYSQLLAWVRPTPALASSEKFADQRVETKQYRSVPGQAICLRFQVSVRGPASFLRINDLESLKESGLRYVRSDEQEWTLSR